MIDKEALVIDLLKQHLPEIKVGVIIKGIDDINPKHSTFMHHPGFRVRAPMTPGEYREAWADFMAHDTPI